MTGEGTTRAGAERIYPLDEDGAQALALVRAVEETDRAGEVLSIAERRRATETARAAFPDDEGSWLAARSRDLVGILRREIVSLPRLMRLTRPVQGLLLPAVAVAFALGLATNALGPEKRINVLSASLLGLMAWNLLMLILTVVRTWLPVPGALSGKPRFASWLEAMARRLVDRLPARSGESGESPGLRTAMRSYLDAWLPAALPVTSTRARRLLHVSSLALIAGVVSGMYLRGIAFEYRATWESTFLNAGTVDRFLGAVLAPASALLGIPVPGAEAIQAPASGEAGVWIHLWAVTAALVVGLPRAILAAVENFRVARHRRRVEIRVPDGYVRRLLASAETSARRLEVLPYSYRPRERAIENLKGILFDLFGPRSEIRVRATLGYGAEAYGLEPAGARLRVVLFGLAQTPETEVHGELLERLKAERADGQALLVMVDASRYRRRLEGADRAAERLDQRRQAWDRVVREARLEALHLDLDEAPTDELLSRAALAAWPAGALEDSP